MPALKTGTLVAGTVIFSPVWEFFAVLSALANLKSAENNKQLPVACSRGLFKPDKDLLIMFFASFLLAPAAFATSAKKPFVD